SRFGSSATLNRLTPVILPPVRFILETRPSCKNDRYHRGSRFCREARSGSADSGNHGNLAANQITRQVWQSIILPFRPAVLDRHVLALDKTAFLETLAERIQLRHRRVG